LQKPTEEIVQEERAEIQRAEEAHPIVAGVTKIATGLPAVAAATLAGAPAVATAAAFGAVGAAGEAIGDAADRLDDALLGGAIGAGLGVAAKAAAPALSKAGSVVKDTFSSVGNAFKDVARRLSTKAIRLKDVRGLNLTSINKLGDMLLNKNITSKTGSLSIVKKRLGEVVGKAGNNVKQLYRKLDDVVGVNDIPTSAELTDDIVAEMAEKSATESFPGIVRKEMEDFLGAAGRPDKLMPTDLIKLVTDLEKEGKRFIGAPANLDVENKRTALIEIGRAIRKRLKGLALKHVPKDVKEYVGSLETFAVLKRAESEIEKFFIGQFKDASSRIAGPGIIREIAEKTLLSTPVRTTLAGTFKAASRLMKTPAKLGKYAETLLTAASRGEKALNSAVFVLSQQSPEFRKILNKEREKEDEKNAR
jgi:hypothetical protein